MRSQGLDQDSTEDKGKDKPQKMSLGLLDKSSLYAKRHTLADIESDLATALLLYRLHGKRVRVRVRVWFRVRVRVRVRVGVRVRLGLVLGSVLGSGLGLGLG